MSGRLGGVEVGTRTAARCAGDIQRLVAGSRAELVAEFDPDEPAPVPAGVDTLEPLVAAGRELAALIAGAAEPGPSPEGPGSQHLSPPGCPQPQWAIGPPMLMHSDASGSVGCQ